MDQSWAADYRVGDCVYSIVEKGDLHARLKADEEFLKNYVTQSSTNTELRMIDANALSKEGTNPTDSETTFRWDPKPTQFYLKLYMERADRFRDPKTRKKSLWKEITQEMIQAGYKVDEDVCDRKMRNMRKTFKTIKQNMRKPDSKPHRWEYFDVFEHMFGNDIIVNCDPLSSNYVDTSQNLPRLSSEDETYNSSPPPSPSPRRKFTTKFIKREKRDRTENPGSSADDKKPRPLRYIREKMLKVEERKAAASEDLNRILRKTNQIMQERNDLLRRFLDTRNLEY